MYCKSAICKSGQFEIDYMLTAMTYGLPISTNVKTLAFQIHRFAQMSHCDQIGCEQPSEQCICCCIIAKRIAPSLMNILSRLALFI